MKIKDHILDDYSKMSLKDSYTEIPIYEITVPSSLLPFPKLLGKKKSSSFGNGSDTDEDFNLAEERKNMKRDQKLQQGKNFKINDAFSFSFGSPLAKDRYGKVASNDQKKISRSNNKTSSPISPSQQNLCNDRLSLKSSIELIQKNKYHDRIIVLIEDYDFSVNHIDIFVNQEIEFALSKDIPHHAEHQLVGFSSVKQLCFESPLLQVKN